MIKFFTKIILFVPIVVFAMILSGCADKTVFPAAHFTVVSLTPDKIRLSASVASATAVTLPGTSVAISSDSKIPASLVSFSISYTTRFGEPISQLEVPETQQNLQLPPNTVTNIGMNPYTSGLYSFFSSTASAISPVNAIMHFKIEDVNGNIIQIDANCPCYASWDEVL